MNVQDLINIFYSGYDAFPDWEILDELLILIRDEIIVYQQEKVCSKKEYFMAIDQVKGFEGLGPQQKGHMALKEMAQKFLLNKNLESWTEHYFHGLHPDVLSKDFSWIIECGNTVPNVIFSFLKDKRVKSVYVFPYPNEDEDYLTLHLFSRGKNFQKFVDFRKQKQKETFEKFHRQNL